MEDNNIYHWWSLIYKFECEERTYKKYVNTKKKLLPKSIIDQWDKNSYLINISYLGKGTITDFNK